MARPVEDVLSRRTRSLLLDAHATIEAAPAVARLMSRELEKDEDWVSAQIRAFREIAVRYCLDPVHPCETTE